MLIDISSYIEENEDLKINFIKLIISYPNNSSKPNIFYIPVDVKKYQLTNQVFGPQASGKLIIKYTLKGVVYVKPFFIKNNTEKNKIKEEDCLKNFDPYQYSNLNPDLLGMSAAQLKEHFLLHSHQENRKIKDPYYDEKFFIEYNKLSLDANYKDYILNITYIKSKKILNQIKKIKTNLKDLLLLVSHENSIYGATHYLYSLYNLLKKKYPNKNILIAENFPNKTLIKKYNINPKSILYYRDDPTLLYYICEKLNPNLIYFNSFNCAYRPVIQHLKSFNVLLHSHEISEHYKAFNVVPDYVVSSRISAQYNNIPSVQPPFLTEEVLKKIDLAKPNFQIINSFGVLDNSRITIGMSGSVTIRKNPKLFVALAREFKEHNFVWIGGDSPLEDRDIPNLYHVKNTIEPYGYYKTLDYFLLTSDADPCPYVVLENLYINNRIITFKPNIYTSHKSYLLNNLYYEWPNYVSFAEASKAIKEFVHSKKHTKSQNGKKYILNFFKNPPLNFLKKLL